MKAEDAETLARQLLNDSPFDERTRNLLLPHTIKLFKSAREPENDQEEQTPRDRFKDILYKMADALEHHSKYLRRYAELGSPPPNDEDYEADEEESTETGELGKIAQDLQIMGEDLERLVEEGPPRDEVE